MRFDNTEKFAGIDSKKQGDQGMNLIRHPTFEAKLFGKSAIREGPLEK